MLFRVELRTDDPELIRMLQGVKNRARFVSMALRHFVSTKQGRETFALMSRPGLDRPEDKESPKLSGEAVLDMGGFLKVKPEGASPGGKKEKADFPDKPPSPTSGDSAGRRRDEDGFDSGRFL